MRVVKNQNKNSAMKRWKTPLSNYACAVRPVAAIMVTRIGDFKKLAERDHATALVLLSKSYKLQEYYGKLAGYTAMVKLADTVLFSFDSLPQATECAIKIERSARKMFNHNLSIGIHLGEVRYVNGDLFGGPVNIAYDIQKMAKPGEILLSEPAARSIGSSKFQVVAHGTCGPLSISTYKVESKVSKQVHPMWGHHNEPFNANPADLRDAI